MATSSEPLSLKAINSGGSCSTIGSFRKLKIVLLGDKAVGKSSIIRRYTSNHFQEVMSVIFYGRSQPTVGVDFMTKKINYKSTQYKLELWDTAGQEKYRSLVKGYLKGADVCVFVYDSTNLATYETIAEWVNIFDSVANQGSIKIVAANKIDILDKSSANTGGAHGMDYDQAKQQIQSKFAALLEINETAVSAKTGDNIEELFDEIMHQSWLCKTMVDVGTSKTLRSLGGTEAKINIFKHKYENKCCNY